MSAEMFVEGLRFLQTNRAFLGREFLTWLWFLSEVQNHHIDVPGLGEFSFFVDDKIVLTSTSGSVHESTLKGGTPAYATEARTALLSGKLVQEAKFILQDGEREWMWSMRADDFSLRGLRLPGSSEADATSHIVKRIAHVQTLIDVLDHLFKKYMSLRLTPQFAKELEYIAAWVDTKLTNESKD